jgi:hypothetical protein
MLRPSHLLDLIARITFDDHTTTNFSRWIKVFTKWDTNVAPFKTTGLFGKSKQRAKT